MNDLEQQDMLKNYLLERGHSERIVAKILSRLEEYDNKTVADSVFDSIERGTFNLDSFISEALAEEEEAAAAENETDE